VMTSEQTAHMIVVCTSSCHVHVLNIDTAALKYLEYSVHSRLGIFHRLYVYLIYKTYISEITSEFLKILCDLPLKDVISCDYCDIECH
jgi:hypothetical protein